jgi:hypothetical protein
MIFTFLQGKESQQRGTSEYSRALAAILWSWHTHILLIFPIHDRYGWERSPGSVVPHRTCCNPTVWWGPLMSCAAVNSRWSGRIVTGMKMMLLSERHGHWWSLKGQLILTIPRNIPAKPATVNCFTLCFLFCGLLWWSCYFIPSVQTYLQHWKFLLILLWINSMNCPHLYRTIMNGLFYVHIFNILLWLLKIGCIKYL